VPRQFQAIYDAMYASGEWKRKDDEPNVDMELIGSRFRRGRQQAGLSQRRVAERAGVSQSEISRIERGRAGGVSTRRFIAVAIALGPNFPLGCCPHNHGCAYPYDPRGKQNHPT
jgi:DNA-binding XRE family transcriptional regulator